ncbi:exodeoxyribonuclease I [Aliikangiella coralliicola]|uniref:Exodeoxyribonuclease I n=1 Tax=Aliikangiella coralliicola TaxID=2592383 RepID=A0A545UG89_9GAMM|nr:exodeoxyribonuclease I [Aliikangiella coralliicola]TQV88413.1 exodeoxyribonuclease I [Aliikangiella coralliicola]
METFYWFDFETFGANPARDRPAQFAGIRTDMDFNIIDEPLNLFCKPADDFLPHPEACLITGITPQLALEKGICERDFFRQIHLELSTPGTCAVGYNSIRFDDEVVRFGLYRNFFDAYTREWQNGNSRWDIIDMLRMTHALRPEGINWVKNEDGNPSFRLEQLSVANNVEHENAHDALADVYATIAMAKLVKECQPKLFDYLFKLRDKRQVAAKIDLITHQPFVHCSAMLGPQHQYCAVMLPLVAHPTNKNSAICLDLTKPIDDLSSIDADTIKQRIFTRQDDLPEGVNRLPIKEVHYNKCPAVAPLNVLSQKVQDRLGINVADCLKVAESLKPQLQEIKGKLLTAYQENQFEPITNPDFALYSGGFFKPSDRNKMDKIRASDWDALANSEFNFDDKRLPEMLFRYRARNAPDTLSEAEQDKWRKLKQENLLDESSGSTLQFNDLMKSLEFLQQDYDNDRQILEDVKNYALQLVATLTE